MKPLDKTYGDFMTIEQYKQDVLEGYLTAYDGVGYYCTEAEESEIHSGFNSTHINKAKALGFNYVMWYNK